MGALCWTLRHGQYSRAFDLCLGFRLRKLQDLRLRLRAWTSRLSSGAPMCATLPGVKASKG